jgi:hypothetical protein
MHTCICLLLPRTEGFAPSFPSNANYATYSSFHSEARYEESYNLARYITESPCERRCVQAQVCMYERT